MYVKYLHSNNLRDRRSQNTRSDIIDLQTFDHSVAYSARFADRYGRVRRVRVRIRRGQNGGLGKTRLVNLKHFQHAETGAEHGHGEHQYPKSSVGNSKRRKYVAYFVLRASTV